MEFIVQARENSVSGPRGQNIGTFNRGDVLSINCSPEDSWNIASNQEPARCNALGLANFLLPIEGKAQTLNAGALVGSFDEGQTFFPIGMRLQMTIIEDNTTVKLYCWDINDEDNSGGISTQVSIQQGVIQTTKKKELQA